METETQDALAPGSIVEGDPSKPRKGKLLFVHRPAGLGFVQLFTDIWFHGLSAEVRATGGISKITIKPWLSPLISLGRNLAVKNMLENGYDYLLMVDPDMSPDVYVGFRQNSKMFWSSSYKFLEERPCGVVVAPCTGPRPERPIYVWRHCNNGEYRRLTHDEAQEAFSKPKFEHVVAGGTGVMLIDRPALEKLKAPYFEDAFYDQGQMELRTTSDVRFCEKCWDAEIPVWCNWYSFAGHIQMACGICPGVPIEGENGMIPMLLDA